MEIKEEKRALRRHCRELRDALENAYFAAADETITRALLSLKAWREAESVFLYVSLPGEPDTRALIRAGLEAGKAVYVPLCGPGGSMRAMRLRDPDALRPGLHGIPEPYGEGEALDGAPDLCVVPCVCADASGGRLGHGAGFYDRYLAAHPCPTVCLCYARLLQPSIPCEESDVRMDAVLTEKSLSKKENF